MKKLAVMVIIVLMSVVCLGTAQVMAADYPTKNITCVIQWGAGGGTDNIMRPLCTLAEKELGRSLIMQNMTGGTGSIATQFVYDKAADGYTLLIGAENPALYDTLKISKLTYKDFVPIFLVGDETIGIIVKSGSKYKTLTDVVNDAKANPGKVKFATAGKGSTHWMVDAYLSVITGAKFTQIPYDSDAAARTAVLNGECDLSSCKIQSGLEAYKAKQIDFLAVIADKQVSSMPAVPVITKEYPGFSKYLPWGGAFYGVFAKNGTDAAVVSKLGDAFKKAFNNQKYQELLAHYSINPIGTTGGEANEYITHWRTRTIEILESSGAISVK